MNETCVIVKLNVESRVTVVEPCLGLFGCRFAEAASGRRVAKEGRKQARKERRSGVCGIVALEWP